MAQGSVETGELSSLAVALEMEADIQRRTADLLGSGIVPNLAILADNYIPQTPTQKYIDLKKEKGAALGIEVSVDICERLSVLGERIELYNGLTTVHAMINQLPLRGLAHNSKHARDTITDNLLRLIAPQKDADGLGSTQYHEPATPLSIISLLDSNGVEYTGDTKVLLRGNGQLVNRPLGPMLRTRGVVNLETIDIDTPDHEKDELLNDADIIVSATGKPNSLTRDAFKEAKPRVFIDAGSAEQQGVMVGDLSDDLRAWILDHGGRVTPKWGGIGRLTILHLLTNVVDAAELHLVGSSRTYRTPYQPPKPDWYDLIVKQQPA